MQFHLIRHGKTYEHRNSGRVHTRRVTAILQPPGTALGDAVVQWVDAFGAPGESSLRVFAVWAQRELTSSKPNPGPVR